MNDEHNIDRLFQESFKDFEVDAPKNAWANIENHLTQKTGKPVIPIWQKLGGVAAVIGILILVGSQLLINPFDSSTNNTIVDAPQNNVNNNTPNENFSNPILTNPLDFEDSNSLSESPNEAQINPNNTLVKSAENTIISKNLTSITAKTSEQNNSKTESLVTLNSGRAKGNQVLANNFTDEETFNIASSFSSKNLIQQHKQIISAKSIQNNTHQIDNPQKQSLIEVAQSINDDFTEKPKTSHKSWYVKPQISPVFYGNLGSGSAIDANLADNNSQGEVNMSYGVNVAYELNNKIKLRTGVNRVNLNYTTNDVFLVQSEGLTSLNNVNTSSSFNASVLNSQQLENLNTMDVSNRIPVDQSELRQELGYIEIPLELEYKLLDKKVDINLIGGASTLLLNNNNLDIRNINGTASVGEANNLNNLSFSTNFAIGLDYDISKRFIFNLEPTFKYQLNTFQTGTTNFQPYFLAIYSGIIFKF